MRCCRIGSYKCEISLEAPYWSSRQEIQIDKCLKDEVLYLWERGIITGGCCCGHKILPPTIAVYPESIFLMKKLGYKEFNKEYIFYAKTKKYKERIVK